MMPMMCPKTITKSKKAYYVNILENSYKNTSKIWKVINNITNRQKKDSRFPHRLDVNEKSYTKLIDIVNKLNINFSESRHQSNGFY